MRSTMQDFPLTIGSLMKHGTTVHADSEVVTATADGIRSQTYAELGKRAAKLANGLRSLGHRRRPAGRHLPVEQRRAPRGLPGGPVDGRGAAHAEHPAVPRAARLHRQPRRGPGRHRRRLARRPARPAPAGDEDRRSTCSSPAPTRRPPTSTRCARAARRCCSTRTCWPTSPRSSTGPRSTSATRPRCATRAARPATPRASSTATARRGCTPRWSRTGNIGGLSFHDRVLPIVPMFHANAWGLAYAALMSGASLCMPDRWLQAEPLCRFMTETQADRLGRGADGVERRARLPRQAPREEAGVAAADPVRRLRRTRLAAAGARGAARPRDPPGLGDDRDLAGGLGRPAAGRRRGRRRRGHYRGSQGRVACGVEGRIVADDGSEQPWDGEAVGELEVRGPWVTAGYYNSDDPEVDEKFHDGWLRTGDVGLDRRARLHPAHRPGQGRDQVRRRVDLLGRPRERADGPRRRRRGGGDRHPGREVGRAAAGLGRRARGRHADARPSCASS